LAGGILPLTAQPNSAEKGASKMATSQEPGGAQALPKIANPAPLGLAGFGLTTVLLSCINAGLIPADGVNAVVPMAFAFGGLAQLIAGVLEYFNGNTFGTVAFTSYGCFWWWYAFLVWTMNAGWLKPPPGNAVALALALWGFFTLGMWISTFRSSKAVWTVFLLLWITFFLLAAGDFGLAALKPVGGYVGILTGVAALYLSFAEVTNGTFGRTVIPVGEPFVKE
jgi:succinate-acetate transporter protein